MILYSECDCFRSKLFVLFLVCMASCVHWLNLCDIFNVFFQELCNFRCYILHISIYKYDEIDELLFLMHCSYMCCVLNGYWCYLLSILELLTVHAFLCVFETESFISVSIKVFLFTNACFVIFWLRHTQVLWHYLAVCDYTTVCILVTVCHWKGLTCNWIKDGYSFWVWEILV